MQLSLGFSPCPNDTFLFYGMIHQKVDTEGLSFDVLMADVEELNQKAFANVLNITKLSYHAYAYLMKDYVLLDAGSALGNNCGPLLIAKQAWTKEQLQQASVAIPGKYTTANFLFSLAYPEVEQKETLLFSEIEQAVLADRVAAGVIIHENRFTYQDKGLVKLVDLGEFWESTYQLPIPLGGIVIQRTLPIEIQQKVNRILRRSVAYAFENEAATMPFVRQYAQEMEEVVMKQHIALYVNDYTLDLGVKGKAAVRQLFEVAWDKRIIPVAATGKDIFLNN
ncbi:MAG: 1,4-dihydroxy-6-naphthoate synthase [Bacteroidota bacterium]